MRVILAATVFQVEVTPVELGLEIKDTGNLDIVVRLLVVNFDDKVGGNLWVAKELGETGRALGVARLLLVADALARVVREHHAVFERRHLVDHDGEVLVFARWKRAVDLNC